ncbi:RagB/SusD family nutrient uptake outer membrane protein [Bacteroides sp. K03]|uniref:RagB/SusD family nutrient uptake outer membrane protein n=1 Tax=Bacteroides sp. K03 TaxID=2718928 RepID=UPI001C8C0471|nr:RagB/SusD family nutrient uptake outer membrane protein [Bacteroides sp. K03]MBX9187620.1 RagB/SusD family nutrient uptake outer membrane protein [Bacteroides sp. K03]
MNKILKTIIFCTGAFSLASCSDFLDQTSPSEMTQENVFQSAVYTKQAVNKIYAGLTRDHMYGCRLPLNFSTNSDIELVDATTEANITNTGNERGNCNYYTSVDWNRLPQTWQYIYASIESANECIEGIRNAGMQPEVLPSLGESLTLRAMLFYDLIKNYGDVPMKMETTSSDGSNIYLSKTDRDVIYDLLLADLQEAAGYLPWQGSSSYTSERVNKGFALGMIARIALAEAGYSIRERAIPGYETAAHSDGTYPTQRPGAEKRKALYELAATALNELIGSGRHTLNPSFENEWYRSNQLVLDQEYRENLYEVAHGLNYSGEMGYTAGVRMNGVSNWGFNNSSGKVKLTAPFFWSFDPEDQRRDVTCAPYEYRATDNVLVQTLQGNKPWEIYVGKWDFRKMSDAWKSMNQKVTAKTGYGINWIVMRYSDALLMYAEVMNELYGADQKGSCGLSARDALYQVHSRAFSDKTKAQQYVNNLNSGTEFFEAVVQERAWELAGEGIRKYDLIRWGLLAEKIEQMRNDYVNKIVPNAPAKLWYKMAENSTTEIDYSSICWYQAPEGTDEELTAAGWLSVSYYGADAKEMEAAANIIAGKLISSGLDATVINRHLFPIGRSTISDSNGTLSNSYGF